MGILLSSADFVDSDCCSQHLPFIFFKSVQFWPTKSPPLKIRLSFDRPVVRRSQPPNPVFCWTNDTTQKSVSIFCTYDNILYNFSEVIPAPLSMNTKASWSWMFSWSMCSSDAWTSGSYALSERSKWLVKRGKTNQGDEHTLIIEFSCNTDLRPTFQFSKGIDAQQKAPIGQTESNLSWNYGTEPTYMSYSFLQGHLDTDPTPISPTGR